MIDTLRFISIHLMVSINGKITNNDIRRFVRTVNAILIGRLNFPRIDKII